MQADASAAGFVAALDLASQPNYLGSPAVVHQILFKLLSVTIDHDAQRASDEDLQRAFEQTASAFSTDTAYTKMTWHSDQGLGKAAITFLNLDAAALERQSLNIILQHACGAVALKIKRMLKDYTIDPNAQWDPHALQQLNNMHQFVTSVMLGTNEISFPGRTLQDFSWQSVNLDA